jgi:lysophospholipase L1-like esterase
MRKRLLYGALAACLSVLTVAAPAGAAARRGHHHGARATPHYYLALGDSLSVGYQPVSLTAGIETTQGYANDLAATYGRRVKGLKLVDLGCPGETTTSMITGHGNAAAVAQFRCPEPQLRKAIAFLRTHHRPGEVPLVTIDIGANDVDGCASSPSTIASCIEAGLARIKADLPRILGPLKRAAPRGTRFVGMNLYDPFLAAYLAPYSPLHPLAEPSVILAQQINAAIGAADRRFGFRTADVFDAFMTGNTTPTPFVAGTEVPSNVAEVCALTWECTQYQNIHANAAGYAVIAKALETVIGRL